MDEQLQFLSLIASRLDGAGIPYMVTGSLAMALYAVPRMTRDIDLVVECALDDAARLASLFEADCYVEEAAVREAVLGQSIFNIIHNDWVIKADFIIRKDETYRKVEFERRRRIDVGGVSFSVVAPEDLVLSKLYWARDSQSESQQRDVRLLIGSLADLDWPYLERWARTLDVSHQLLDARTE